MVTFATLEENARRAKEANSFSDYKPGSATAEYQEYCNRADEIAKTAKERLKKAGAPAERIEKVDYLLQRYKDKKLEWLNDLYAAEASVPSVMITGSANFPARQKERQNARIDDLYRHNPDYILDKIKSIGYNANTIYSDEKDAVERIKAKIVALEQAPRDPWGYNKAEIRRLKGRLLKLAPEEFAEQQKDISVNGAKTYADIVKLWDNGKHYKSQDNWYFDLPLVFTDGKRRYQQFVSIEVDESGKNQVSFDIKKCETVLIPLTDKRKYNIIISRIAGSGNKAIIFQYLQKLQPKSESSAKPDTITINGETAQIIRNKEIMRLQLAFDDKPSEATRKALKANGFRWAPSSQTWQRLLNDHAENALRCLA